MIPVRPTPPPPPPPSPAPNGSPAPSLWCGVVVASFSPPCGVVGSVGGSACCGSHPPPCGMVWVRVFLWWLPLASLGLLWVFGILVPMMMIMMMGMMITIFIINSKILMFLWLVVGCLLPTCLVTIFALWIVGPLSS